MNGFFSSRKNKKIDPALFEPLILFSVLFLPGYISQGFGETDPAIFESLYFNIYYMITSLPVIALILYVISMKPDRCLADFDIGAFRLRDLPLALIAFAGIWACIIPVGFISMLIEPAVDNQLIYGEGWQFGTPAMIPVVLISCIITGYTEEIFFRSYLYTSFKNSGAGTAAAVAVTSLLFGGGHIYEGYYAFAATAVIGLFLSFIFIKTRSIHAVAIGHGLYNLSVLLISMTGEL